MGTGGEDAPPSTGGGSTCAPYDATSAGPWQYIGELDIDWVDNSTAPPSNGVEVVRFSFDVKCSMVDGQGVTLWITSASVSNSNSVFGTGTQTFADGTSFMTMPPNPPTTPSNLVQPGQGIFFGFSNGTQLGIAANKAGDFSVLGYASHISIASTPGVMPGVHLISPTGLVSGHPNAVLTPKSWALNSAA